MTNLNEITRENTALCNRVSQLSAAILRINASLDVDTVLQEVVDSARTLTGARYGMIVTLDERGDIRDFASSDFTGEAHRRFEPWPDGPRLFKQLRGLPGVVRLAKMAVVPVGRRVNSLRN